MGRIGKVSPGTVRVALGGTGKTGGVRAIRLARRTLDRDAGKAPDE